MNPKLILGLAFGFASALIWGGHAVIARPVLADGSFSSFDLAAFRYGVGMMALLPFAWAARATLLRLGLRRILLLALVYAPASHGGTIAPMTSPIVGALLAIPLLREWPTRGRAMALGVMVMGVLMIGWDGVMGDYPGAWRGDLLLMASGATWAVFTLLLRRWQVPAIPATAAITIVSGLAILPFWLPMRAAEVFAMPAGLVLFHLIAQGLVLGCVAMFFFARAVELLGATRAATLSVMVPVVALLLAGLWLREPLSWLQILGAGLAVAGMLAAVLFTGRKSA